ncbi:MAG: histone deacetylase [Planctomycetota bacterium]|nr:histone deacetylase [Planctomycetota bacterium]
MPKPSTLVVHDENCLKHDTGAGHPEQPARYTAVMNGLKQAGLLAKARTATPRAANLEDLRRCHSDDYLKTAQRDVKSGMDTLSTGDTAVCRDSWSIALQASGAACLAVEQVLEGKAKNAFCVMRPPGHHATPTKGMGFCLVNNVAVAARYAQAKHKVGKVLIVDWDVHHGNGTQDIFYDDDSVMFFSTHQSPWYPGTGDADETGRGKGLGATMNRPFPAGSGRRQVFQAFEEMRVVAEKFKPELVLISAGFDSRIEDPLGQFQLVDQDFADLTDFMLKLADDFADGHVVSLLEGGYNLDGLAKAASAHCARLLAHE